MFKSLSIMQIAGLIAGALLLNKVLKAKIGVVAKNGQTVDSTLALDQALDSLNLIKEENLSPELPIIGNTGIVPQTFVGSSLMSTNDYFN